MYYADRLLQVMDQLRDILGSLARVNERLERWADIGKRIYALAGRQLPDAGRGLPMVYDVEGCLACLEAKKADYRGGAREECSPAESRFGIEHVVLQQLIDSLYWRKPRTVSLGGAE